jgi:mannose-6-phosphate isomerase
MSPAEKYLLKGSPPLRVEGCIQEYAWGKVGVASRIAPFMRVPPTDVPLAEYWLGCHPKGSAVVLLPDGSRCPITDLLPEQTALPFMLKVLSINPAFGLSIQSHPDAQVARQLHSRDPGHYPDPFHKPEVGIALSPVQLLYNIKAPGALRRLLARYPELVGLLSEKTQRELKALENKRDVLARKGIFSDCITAAPEAVSKVVTAILKRSMAASQDAVPEEIVTMERLAQTHGTEDPGLVVLLLMNLVSLNPGEAIFIGPNIPHAYLDGDLVECMACSDNVIRAGLTTKFRDVSTLIETTAYDLLEGPQCVRIQENCPGYIEFLLPVQEFQIGVIQAGAHKINVDISRGHALALCVGESSVVSYGSGGEHVTLRDGEAVLLPQGMRGCQVSTASAQLFVACSGSI